MAKTIADLRNAHDKAIILPRRVKATLDALRKSDGPEAHMYEQDVMRKAKVGSYDISRMRKEFAAHIVVTAPTNGKSTSRKVWFADVKIAAKVCKDYPEAFTPWEPTEE